MPKKDMGLSLYSIKENKVVLKISYANLRKDTALKSEIRQKIISGDYKLYCNCNPKERIEKKIDIALRIYDAKKDTYNKHLYNCAGSPVASQVIDGCFCNEDGVLVIDNVCFSKNDSQKTPLITAIKNIHSFIWNQSSGFHYRKVTHDKIKNELKKNNVDESLHNIYENIILFHRKIFLSLQENQIILNGRDLSSILYNTKFHKFKDLKQNESQFFQMIVSNIVAHNDKLIIQCINNFIQKEDFILKNKKLIKKYKDINLKDNVYCIAGFVRNVNGEKDIIDCEIYVPSKRGLITSCKEEKIIYDTFTDNNINFKCVMNYEFTKFFHPILIVESKDNDILYDLLMKNETFEEIKKKDDLAKSIGVLYRYWKTDFSDKPYIPKELRKNKKH